MPIVIDLEVSIGDYEEGNYYAGPFFLLMTPEEIDYEVTGAYALLYDFCVDYAAQHRHSTNLCASVNDCQDQECQDALFWFNGNNCEAL